MKVEPRELKLKAATEGAQMEKKKFFGDLSVILAGAVMFAVGNVLHHLSMDMWALVVFGVAYFILGGKILLEAAKNISHGQIFDENFLMCIATIGAFVIQEYPEAPIRKHLGKFCGLKQKLLHFSIWYVMIPLRENRSWRDEKWLDAVATVIVKWRTL